MSEVTPNALSTTTPAARRATVPRAASSPSSPPSPPPSPVPRPTTSSPPQPLPSPPSRPLPPHPHSLPVPKSTSRRERRHRVGPRPMKPNCPPPTHAQTPSLPLPNTRIVLSTPSRYSWRRLRNGQLKIGKITARNKISASKRTVSRKAPRRKPSFKGNNTLKHLRKAQERADWSRAGTGPKDRG